jgi:hypothetical protein
MTGGVRLPLGRDFLGELLFAIAAGNSTGETAAEVLEKARKRVSAARKLLFEEHRGAGRPYAEDDMELIEIGYWILHLMNADEERPSSLDVPEDVLRNAVKKVAKDTPEAKKESRRRTLARKFQKERARIMQIIEADAYGEKQEEYSDLVKIGDMLKQHGIGFDLYASNLRKRLRNEMKSEAGGTNKSKRARRGKG